LPHPDQMVFIVGCVMTADIKDESLVSVDIKDESLVSVDISRHKNEPFFYHTNGIELNDRHQRPVIS
jgi:hypothetical protein